MSVDLGMPTSTMRGIEIDHTLAQGNYLTANGLGGYLISASAIGSWSYCQLRRFYELQARHDPSAPQGIQLSATAFGSVIHGAIMQMELAIHEGSEDPLGIALRFFEHYWYPANIGAICPPVEEWIGRETYLGLLERGRYVLRTYYETMARRKDDYLLALEYDFAVPIVVRGRTHTLTGQIDRLTIRRRNRKPYVSVDDLKTGKRPYYLRHNTQGHSYAYATTCVEFWKGWPESGRGELQAFPPAELSELEMRFASWGYALHNEMNTAVDDQDGMPLAARRFQWVDLKNMKPVDGGWRTTRDYARLVLAIDAMVRAAEAEIYAVNADGEKCQYCPHKNHCGGVGLPSETEGAP
jgi:hypothetical protein